SYPDNCKAAILGRRIKSYIRTRTCLKPVDQWADWEWNHCRYIVSGTVVKRPVAQVRVRCVDANLGTRIFCPCRRSHAVPGLLPSIPTRSPPLLSRVAHSGENCSTSNSADARTDPALPDYDADTVTSL